MRPCVPILCPEVDRISLYQPQQNLGQLRGSDLMTPSLYPSSVWLRHVRFQGPAARGISGEEIRSSMIGVTAVLIASEAAAPDFVIEETTVAGIQQALQTNARTGRQIVQAYLDRIAAYDHKGPAFNSILTLNPKALAEADRLDAERATGAPVGPLHCVPLVLKDNYNTADLPTTGGSASLAGMQPPADAFVVAKLRKAGAIILGKSNMHELALSGTP